MYLVKMECARDVQPVMFLLFITFLLILQLFLKEWFLLPFSKLITFWLNLVLQMYLVKMERAEMFDQFCSWSESSLAKLADQQLLRSVHLPLVLRQLKNIDAKSFSNYYEGGTWGCEKMWEGGPLFSCFMAFLWSNFWNSFEGVHEVPPLLPPCVHLWRKIIELSNWSIQHNGSRLMWSLWYTLKLITKTEW